VPGAEAQPGSLTLTAWIYDSALGAVAGEVRMWALRKKGLIVVDDAVTVTWVGGAHRPRIAHLRHQLRPPAGRGVVLPLIVRYLLRPSIDLRDLARLLQGSGIEQHFLDAVRIAVVPGTSALMVVSSTAKLDDVRPAIERGLARGDVSLLHVWLTPSALDVLHRAAQDLAAGVLH
jgi:uncharacterized membrane protein